MLIINCFKFFPFEVICCIEKAVEIHCLAIFFRWNKTSEWVTNSVGDDLDWKKIVEPVMTSYTEATDGSSIEVKESALVWHHQDADPDFGSCQSKELLDHLENVLANEPAVVKRGQHIVEVKPQVQLTYPYAICVHIYGKSFTV